MIPLRLISLILIEISHNISTTKYLYILLPNAKWIKGVA